MLLPGQFILERIQGCTFSLVDEDHALRHACSLLSILRCTSTPERAFGQRVISFGKHIPWLIDSLEELSQEQQRWADGRNLSPSPLLDTAISLSKPSFTVDRVVSHKLDAVIVLITSAMADHLVESRDESQTDGAARRIFALALVHLADAAVKSRPLSRLIVSQLLKPLDSLLAKSFTEDERDLQVCYGQPHSLARSVINRRESPAICRSTEGSSKTACQYALWHRPIAQLLSR